MSEFERVIAALARIAAAQEREFKHTQKWHEEVDACTHPELNMQDRLMGGRTYWCSACKKKIIIPNHTLTIHGQEGLGGIIGLAFGEKWGQLASEGRV